MQNLFTWSFWFKTNPGALMPWAQKLFIALIILLAIAALIIALIKKKGGIYRGLLKRLYGFCLGNAIIGLILLFFNYELVPFFSARFWLGLWIITLIVWLILVLKNLRVIPEKKKQSDQEKEFKKYLP